MIGAPSPHLSHASHLSSISEENFWPSFTDIMMVVVIVFLLSSLVAVLHNWDLSRQVQETIALERQARERAEDLNVRQMLLQLELEEMRSRMDRTRDTLQAKLAQLEARERDLASAREALTLQRSQLAAIQEERARMRDEMRESRTVSAERERELLDVQRRLAEMREEGLLRERMYVEVEAERRQTHEELERLRKEYEEMGEKYAALSRPARSDQGKVVVAVRHRKVDGRPAFTLRLPDASKFEAVEEGEMHQILAHLKREHGDRLFVRIVIPMDSDLTYQDAWRFSLDLLRRYDYYYQE